MRVPGTITIAATGQLIFFILLNMQLDTILRNSLAATVPLDISGNAELLKVEIDIQVPGGEKWGTWSFRTRYPLVLYFRLLINLLVVLPFSVLISRI